MKDKIIERRIKIGLSVLILFLLVVSSSSGILTITDRDVTTDITVDYIGSFNFSNANIINYAGIADYIVGKTPSGTIFARRGDNGTVEFTGSSIAIHTVINQCCQELYTAENRGGKIIILPGSYEVRATIELTPNICLEGSSYSFKHQKDPGVRFVCYMVSYRDVISYDTDDFPGCADDGVSIKNIYFAAYDETVRAFIYVHYHATNTVVEGCSFVGAHDYCIFFDGVLSSWITRCSISWSDTCGIYLNTTRSPLFCPCNAIVIDQCRIASNENDGIYFDEGLTGGVIQSSVVEGNGRYGINLGFDGDGYGAGGVTTTIRDVYFEAHGVSAIYIHESDTTLIDSCFFDESNDFITIPHSAWDYFLYSTYIRNCKFVSCGREYPLNVSGCGTIVDGCYAPGINISWGENVTIKDCTVTNSSWGIGLNGSNTPNTVVWNNNINGSITGYSSDTVMSINTGFVTENYDTCTVANGGTYIVVNHGCDVTPNFVMVTPIETLNSASFWYVHSITSSQFNLTVNQNPGQDVDFVWWARYNP